MRPDSELIVALGELIDQLRSDGADPAVSKWLSEQRNLLITQKNASNIEAGLTVLDARLADLYDTAVVTEGHADLRAVFAKLVGALTATKDAIKEGHLEELITPRGEAHQLEGEAALAKKELPAAPQGTLSAHVAAHAQETPEGEEDSTVANPGISAIGMICLVTASAGFVFILVSVATLSILPANDCSSAVTATKTWLGLIGSLVFGLLTFIIRTIEIQRARRAEVPKKQVESLRLLQYVGIVQIGLFALVCIVLYSHNCKILAP